MIFVNQILRFYNENLKSHLYHNALNPLPQCKQYNIGTTPIGGFTSASRLPCFYSMY